MPFGGPDSERALIWLRRCDAEVASRLFTEAAFAVKICADPIQLIAEFDAGAGFALIGEELAAQNAAVEAIGDWIRMQPPWSDLPIIMPTGRGDAPSRSRRAAAIQERFGNVNFLERPFHPTTLVSLARTALRSRRRQYEARGLLARQELLARELHHRTKNLFAVILSIASASLREGSGGNEIFMARLHSLAKAQDRIFEEGGGGALLDHIVRSIVDTFGARISIEGPPVFVNAGVAQGFALIVHELATNAAKYGALTAPSGHVAVRWSLDASREEPTLTFAWREQGGPPAAAPERRGFGTLLLEKAIASVGGPPRFDYGPGGFAYQITVACR
jgi:two-component sensor histidine kinase